MSKVYKLTEIVNFIGGSQPPKSVFSDTKKDGYIRLIQIRDYKSDNYIVYINKDSTKKFCTEDDIMIGRYGPPVFQILRGINGAYNVALMKAEPKINELSREYLFRFLQNPSIQNYIIGLSQRSAGQSGVNKEALEQYEILLPSLSEQQRIVSKLDLLFEKIDKSIALHQKNIDEANVFMGSVLNDVFGNKICGLKGESLEHLCELIVDCEHKTAPTQETGYPSIRTPNIGKGFLILDNVNRVSEEIYKEWTKRAVPQANDLILAREAPAGNIAVIPENLKVCLGQRTVLIRPKKDKFDSNYLAFLLLSKDVQEQLLAYSRGATVTHINMKDIRAFKIYNLSSLSEQQKVVSYLDDISKKTEKIKQIQKEKMQNLKALKASILDQAFRGEL